MLVIIAGLLMSLFILFSLLFIKSCLEKNQNEFQLSYLVFSVIFGGSTFTIMLLLVAK